MYSANGSVPRAWTPTGSGRNFELSEILSPLEEHKDDLLVLAGVDARVTSIGPGAAHPKGMGALLTGYELNNGNFQGGGDRKSGWGKGISVDQHIANHLKGQTRIESLQLGVRTLGGQNRETCVYAGDNAPILMQNSPYVTFDRLFGNVGIDPAELEKIRARKQSILDFVKDDISRTQKKIGAVDRIRVEAHLESIRKIENQLQNSNGLETCIVSDLGVEQIDPIAMANFPAVAKMQIDLMVRAMACDLTRVGVLQFARGTSSQKYEFLGIDRNHHDLSHTPDNNSGAQADLIAINKWHATQMAYLLTEMKKVKEGDGNMLDNTVVLWGSELGKGNNHIRNELPFVMAGSCGGFFKTGSFEDIDASHNDLLVSIAQAMGSNISTFGNPAYCDGPLSGIHA